MRSNPLRLLSPTYATAGQGRWCVPRSGVVDVRSPLIRSSTEMSRGRSYRVIGCVCGELMVGDGCWGLLYLVVVQLPPDTRQGIVVGIGRPRLGFDGAGRVKVAGAASSPAVRDG